MVTGGRPALRGASFLDKAAEIRVSPQGKALHFTEAMKDKKLVHFTIAWMHLEKIMLSELTQSEKEKYHTISLTCEI